MVTKKIFSLLMMIVLGGGLTVYGLRSRSHRHEADAAERITSTTLPIETVTHQSADDAIDAGQSFPGQLLSTTDVQVYASREGQIKHWLVAIGTHVSEGQVLAVLSSPPASADLVGLLAEKEGARVKAQAQRDATAKLVGETKRQLNSVLDKLDHSRVAALTVADKEVVAREYEREGAERELAALETNRHASIASAQTDIDRATSELPLKKEQARSAIERLVFNSANAVALIRQDNAISPLSDPSEALRMQLKIGIGGATGYITTQYRPALAKVLTDLQDRSVIPQQSALAYGQIVTELLSNSIGNNDLLAEDLKRMQQDTADDRAQMIDALRAFTQAQTDLDVSQAELEKVKAQQEKDVTGAQTFAVNARIQAQQSQAVKQKATADIDVDYARQRQDIETRIAELDRELALADADVKAAQESYTTISSGLQGQDVRAPKAGIISAIQKNVGDFVSPADAIAAVSGGGQDGRFVRFTIPSDITPPQSHDEVTVTRPGLPFSGIKARVKGVGQSLGLTGSLSADAELEEDVDWPVYASVRVTPATTDQIPSIPLTALFWDEMGMANVWVLKTDNTLEMREVGVGRVIGDRVEILNGLDYGDRYVAQATAELKKGQSVDAPAFQTLGKKEDNMNGMEGMDHGGH